MTDQTPARQRLFPIGIGQVQLYHRESVLDSDLDRCRDLGWQVIEFDAAPWVDEQTFHRDLAGGLGFPAHYGRNLDALSDLALEVASGRFGFPVDAVGGVLVFRRVDVLAGQAADRLAALLDIFAGASNWALQHGWPLAIFAQSDDGDLRCDPAAAMVVDWNPAERSRSRRIG